MNFHENNMETNDDLMTSLVYTENFEFKNPAIILYRAIDVNKRSDTQ